MGSEHPNGTTDVASENSDTALGTVPKVPIPLDVAAKQAEASSADGSNTTSKEVPRVGFWDGLAAPWRGFFFLLTTPRVWLWAMIPMVVFVVLFSGLSGLAIVALPKLVAHWIPSATWYLQAGKTMVQILVALLGIILAFFVGLILTQPLSAPALERIVHVYEDHQGLPPKPPVPLLVELWRSTRSALLGCINLPILLLLTVLELVIPGSSVVIIPLKVFITGLFVSWDLLDYPLGIRSTRISERIVWLTDRKAATVGFGVSLAAVFLIPCAQVLLLPVGVAGATALICKDEEMLRKYNESKAIE
jgi:CysZ protein